MEEYICLRYPPFKELQNKTVLFLMHRIVKHHKKGFGALEGQIKIYKIHIRIAKNLGLFPKLWVGGGQES